MNSSLRQLTALFIAASAVATTGATPTPPHTPWYVELGGGVNRRSPANDEIALASFKIGGSYSLGLGYRWSDFTRMPSLRHFRTTLEYARQHNAIDRLWAYPLGGYPVGTFWGSNSGKIGLRNPAMDAVIRGTSPAGQTISQYYGAYFEYPEKARGSIDFETVQAAIYYDYDLSGYTVFLGCGFGAGRSILKNLATPFLDYLAAPGSPIRTTSPGNLFAPPNGSRYDLSYTTNWAGMISPRIGVSYWVNADWEIVNEARYWTAPNRVRVEAYPELDPKNVTHPNVDGWSLELRLRRNF
jgi:hypothetical protein